MTRTRLNASEKSRLDEDGFLLLRGVEEEALVPLASALGRVQIDPRTGSSLKVLAPQSLHDAPMNTLSSRYGQGAFPYHTEGAYYTQPPTHLLLYCRHPGSGGRSTDLLDTRSFRLSARQRLLLSRGVFGVAARPAFASTIVDVPGDRSWRFDRDCMSPLTADAQEASETVEEQIRGGTPARIQWQAGMLAIVANRRILHARGTAVTQDADRTLLRVLVGGLR